MLLSPDWVHIGSKAHQVTWTYRALYGQVGERVTDKIVFSMAELTHCG